MKRVNSEVQTDGAFRDTPTSEDTNISDLQSDAVAEDDSR